MTGRSHRSKQRERNDLLRWQDVATDEVLVTGFVRQRNGRGARSHVLVVPELMEAPGAGAMRMLQERAAKPRRGKR